MSRCAATAKQSGERCKREAIEGGGVCYVHGGAAPQVKAKANERVTDAKARTLADAAGAPALTDPFQALMNLAGEVLTVKDVLGEMVAELREVVVTDVFGHEKLRAHVAAYERALERSAKLLVDIARLDIDDRLVRINEAMATSIYRYVMGVLVHPDLGLDAGKIKRARELLAEATR